MKRLIFTLLLVPIGIFTLATKGPDLPRPLPVEKPVEEKVTDMFSPEQLQMGVDQFLQLTPKKYREMTGKKLGIMNTLKLKAAQRKLKKAESDISPGLYILLAILGFGWLAMGLLTDWEGSDWIVNLILTLLCWLPGLIHALVKKKDYY